jgi:hypothetical protein
MSVRAAGPRVGGDLALGGFGKAGAQRGVGETVAELRSGGPRGARFHLTLRVTSRGSVHSGQDHEGITRGARRPATKRWRCSSEILSPRRAEMRWANPARGRTDPDAERL